jgi:hypothetical protein
MPFLEECTTHRSEAPRVARPEAVGLARTNVGNNASVCFRLLRASGVSLDVGQLIGLAIANVLIVVYFVVAACTGGPRSIHDYVAATEVCPSIAKRDR